MRATEPPGSIIVRNIARVLREKAEGTTIERYFVSEIIRKMGEDPGADIMILRAFALMAIEDHLAGGGPFQDLQGGAR